MQRKPKMSITWLLLLLFTLAACGASAREKTLSAALVTVDAARIGFERFDPEHQVQIARDVKARGGTKEQALAEQAKWQEQRDAIYRAMIAAYAVLILAVEHDDKPIGGVTAAVNALLAKLAEAGAPTPAATPATKGTP